MYVTNLGPDKTSASYPGFNKFSDEGGSGSKGNLINYVDRMTLPTHRQTGFVLM